MQAWRNCCSGKLPGGRTGSGVTLPDKSAPQSFVAAVIAPAPTTAAAEPAASDKKPRRPSGVSCVGGSFSILRATTFHRSTNLMACVGQTPPQVWQSVQSVVRVVKSGLIASNGQISTHLLQLMQVSSTFRSLTRNRLPSEKTAPLGQTYLHQNRGRKMPSPSTTPNSASERKWPAFRGGTLCQPRAQATCSGSNRNRSPRVTTGIAAT